MRRRDLLQWIPAFGLAGGVAYLGGNDGEGPPGSADDGPRSSESIADGRADDPSTFPDSVTVEPGEAETFGDPDAWEVIEGTATADGTCAEGSGETCLRLERGTDRARLARRYERPLDITDVRPSVTLRAAEQCFPMIRLFDVDGDELRLRSSVRGGLDYQPFNFGVERVVGEPDLSRIVEVRINQTGSPAVWLGRMEFHEPIPPTVLLAFDDRFVKNYGDNIPILREYGYDAVVFVDTGSVGGEANLGVDELEALRRAGWDVGNHTVGHVDLRALDEEDQRNEIVGGRRWLNVNGFQDGADIFTYPENNYDQTSLDLVRRWHRLAFAGGFPAAGALPNRLLVPRFHVGGGEEARRAIDLTARFGGVTCLFYEGFDTDSVREFRGTVEHLQRREAAGDVDVATASELADRLES